jgi:hypothetical protein
VDAKPFLAINRIHGVLLMENKNCNDLNEFKTGRKGTADFLIRVMFRDNTSWQGEVHWLDSDKKRSFRSSLELLLLMQEAMDDADAPSASTIFRNWKDIASDNDHDLENACIACSVANSK